MQMSAFRFRHIAALIAVVAALSFVAGAADARVGGGSSFGSRGMRTYSAPPATRTAPSAAPIQRSTTAQPSATSPAAGASTGGFFNRPGLLGGLAAGFLGAGLLGLLFGHGFLGGLGGFASILGLMLQIALVVIVARLLINWWQRRNQPAMAAGPNLRDMGDAPAPRPALGGNGFARPNVTITPADYDAFEHLLGEIQAAYSAEDLPALRTRATPEMVSYFSEDLARNASRGVVNTIADVKLLQGDLAEAWSEGQADYATVAMRFSLIDRVVDRQSGRTVEGDDNPQEITELWTFRRTPGGAWMLSAIQQA
jgi:predicted lipid-binding transport protein (Tim44 family)